MIKVKSSGGRESLEKLLKRFKKKCEKEGLIKDMKRSSYYEKPSERRRREERKMEKRASRPRRHSVTKSSPRRPAHDDGAQDPSSSTMRPGPSMTPRAILRMSIAISGRHRDAMSRWRPSVTRL